MIRVFQRRTRWTPRDWLAFVGDPPLFRPEGDHEVYVSCTFTWDRREAERLAKSWSRFYPTKLGGPAFGDPGGEFVPGRFLVPGAVFTSRGCPNRCWFCTVPQREGREVREYPIEDGWNVFDSNLLACSESHIRAVFEMLGRQPRRAEFTGGLEAARLKDWHVKLLRDLRPKQMFFAYDTPDDAGPLRRAGEMLADAGWTRAGHRLRCYVLCGYPGDTVSAARGRCQTASDAGFLPMAMVYRDDDGKKPEGWSTFQRAFARPAITAGKTR